MEDRREDRSFESLMDPRGPPEGKNPLFNEVPTFHFELYKTDCWPQEQAELFAKKTAKRFISLLSKIKELILQQTARENNGQSQFVEGIVPAVSEPEFVGGDVPATCPRPTFEHYFGTVFQRRNIAYSTKSSNNQIPNSQIPPNPAESVSYRIPSTSSSGLFAVLLQPKGRGDRDEEQFEPIKVIFSLRSLYLLGFVYEEVFYHYEDADVSEIPVTEETKRFILKIPMNGGYTGNDLCEVRIGIPGLWHHYDTLINAKNRTRRQVRQALMSIFVPVAEGIRFPGWVRRLYVIYINNLDLTTDKDDPENKYSQNFNEWDTISMGVARGVVNFKEAASFFVKLLMQSSMLLLSAVQKANEMNDQDKQEMIRRQKEERKSKGKKKTK